MITDLEIEVVEIFSCLSENEAMYVIDKLEKHFPGQRIICKRENPMRVNVITRLSKNIPENFKAGMYFWSGYYLHECLLKKYNK